MGKKVKKFGETEIEKHNFHRHKTQFRYKIQILINYLTKFLLVKRILNILLVTKMVKKLNCCA